MSFIGIDKYNIKTLTTQLEHNIVSFLDDGLLKIGAFGNVSESVSNIYGADMSVLRPSKDPHNVDYTLWQSARKNWIYESITGGSYSPISFSGVSVSGVSGSSFYPAPTGNNTLGYSVNYKEGSILFDQSVYRSAKITASYSYKLFNIEVASQSPLWKNIQQSSFNPSDFNNSYYSSGDFNVPSEHRVQLPTIIVEAVNRSINKPFRLGDHSLISNQKILLHILSENKEDRDKINDILNYQQGRYIYLYDINKLVESGTYPLNFDGSVNNNRLEYDDILANPDYRLMSTRFDKITVSEMKFYGLELYGSTIQIDNELILNQNS